MNVKAEMGDVIIYARINLVDINATVKLGIN